MVACQRLLGEGERRLADGLDKLVQRIVLAQTLLRTDNSAEHYSGRYQGIALYRAEQLEGRQLQEHLGIGHTVLGACISCRIGRLDEDCAERRDPVAERRLCENPGGRGERGWQDREV